MDAVRRASIKARRAYREHETAYYVLAYAQAQNKVDSFWVDAAGSSMIVYVDGRRITLHDDPDQIN